MPKAGELDWSELYKTGKNLEPEHPMSRPLKKGLKGKDHLEEFGKTIVEEIVEGSKQEGIRQPTDEEMFGHLVKSEEEINAMKTAEREAWENKFAALVNWKPAQVVPEHLHKSQDWCRKKSYNELFKDEGLSEEELQKRNMTVE